jgi:hypothetical protein
MRAVERELVGPTWTHPKVRRHCVEPVKIKVIIEF